MPASSRSLAILLPLLPIDRHTRRERAGLSAGPADGAPRAVAATSGNAVRLTAVNAAAHTAGLRVGMPLADARAMRPDLHVDPADPLADQRLLEALADWCQRWTPLAGIAAPDLLMLDIAGCAHLFGGEPALLADVSRRLGAQGFHVDAAIAPNPVAAEAFARARPATIATVDDMLDLLRPLPLGALRLDGDILADLGRMGLTRIGDVLDRPRAPLVKRFGVRLADRLDQAVGQRGAPITPRLPLPGFLAERRFFEPISHRDDVVGVAKALAAEVGRSLERHDEGARRIELALFRVDGGVLRVDVGTSRPVRDATVVADLVARKLETLDGALDVGFGLDVIRLSVLEAGAAAPRQDSLDSRAQDEEALARFVDRVGARLGETRLTRLVPLASHVPEFAMASVPAALRGDFTGALAWAHAPEPDTPPERPIRLLATPEPIEALASIPDGPPVRFRWRRALHEVAHAEGPERIAGEWWRQPAALTRDYFRVEDTAGARFWLYRDGLFGEAPATPRWYLHGVFA